MADVSPFASLVPTIIIAAFVSSWVTNKRRSRLDADVRRVLQERFPGVELISVDAQQVSVRFRGRAYAFSAKNLWKENRERGSDLAPVLQSDLQQTLGVSAEELRQSAPAPAPSLDTLSFDKAATVFPERETVRCAYCQTDVAVEYFEVNGSVSCAGCKDALIARTSRPLTLGALLRAGLYGSGAALVGCLIYYLILKLTGYEIGLIAIVVGLMVGGAVKRGSEERGGPIFQSLAMLLTYAAIVFTYTPFIVQGLRDHAKTAAPAVPAGVVVAKSGIHREAGYTYFVDSDGDLSRRQLSASSTDQPPAAEKVKALRLPMSTENAYVVHENGDVEKWSRRTDDTTLTPVAATGEPGSTTKAPAAPAAKNRAVSGIAERVGAMPAAARVLIGIVLFVGLLFAVPFLAGAKNLMGLLIIGFALYEAWKLNRRQTPTIEGPFKLGRSSTPA